MFNNYYYLFHVNKHKTIRLYHVDPLIIITYFICVKDMYLLYLNIKC